MTSWWQMLRPARLFIVLFFAASLLFAGCGRRESAVERGNRSQVLHRGIGSEVGDLDPHLASSIAEVDIISALFEGLVAEDPVDLHPVPGVAERWEKSPDGLGYTFFLRADARWSDGQPVTAQDFLASWRRILTPSLAAENAGMLYVLEGAEAFHKGASQDFASVGATALDPRTLRVKLEHPSPHFLSLLTHPAWWPVPAAVLAKFGSPFARGNQWTRPGNLVGNGPFTLTAWEPNKFIVVEKSATYWDAAHVRLKAVNFYPTDSMDTEERAFRTGQLHLTYVLPFGKVDTYRKTAPQFLRTDPYLHTYFLRFNVRRPPLDSDLIRRALGMAIDREKIVQNILRGGQRAATAITPPLPDYNPPHGPSFDLNKARELLSQAGFPGGKGLPKIELLYRTSENLRLLAEVIQEMWRHDLGIDVELVNQEFKVLLSERRASHFQVLLSDWVGDYLDATTFLDLWRTDDGNNHTGWSNTEYDSLLFAAARNPDQVARAAQLQRAEALMLAAAPVVPLYYNTHVFLIQPSVKGWHPTLLDHHPYKHVWLEP